MDTKIKVAEIDTTLELFAYWLERDWPRVKEFGWLELRPSGPPQADPRFERRWWVFPRTEKVSFPDWPIVTVSAETMTPSKVVAAWTWGPLGAAKFLDKQGQIVVIQSPIESVANWVWFRFQVKADDLEKDDPASDRTMLASLPERPPVYQDSNSRATVAHYLIKVHKLSQRLACERAALAPHTYRTHRDNGKLLTEDEYQQLWEKSIKDAAKEVLEAR